ncbi:acyltransferase family protein [Phycicoccus avicenniae]|uniref:acyltransferase family protein n=1 Tax=Phycicoccus avicenniae TaxID=2828860 RepID=UPI003D2D6478
MDEVSTGAAGVRTAPAEPGTTAPAVDRSRFRPDIEGLRAIAVVSVMLWHAGLPFLPGGFVGVDVFFVISGYLMTGLLARELQQRRRISFLGFYARRAKRLLPAASVTLVVVALATLVLLPRIRAAEVGRDIVASALYVINWRLAEGSVDYLAADNAPSPVLHFWSLAVEEQFYILWPLVLALIGLLARRRASTTGPVAWGLALIAVPSFLWSVHYTSAEPEKAYFVTTTRLWELAVGGLVAVLGPALARLIAPRVAAAVGWAGLAVVAATMVLLQETYPFPGWVAALPVLGTAAVIAVGPVAGPRGPVAVLRPRPMQQIGKLSYSLYLWHWPVLVVATALLLDRPGHLDPTVGVAVVALSVIPAWLSFRFVEEPVRQRRSSTGDLRRWSLSMGAACTALSLTAGLALVGVAALWERDAARPPANATGAAVLGTGDPRGSAAGRAVDDPGRFTPPAATVRDDIPSSYPDGCHVQDNPSPKAVGCTYGDPKGDYTVALLGDSHAAQWVPTFRALADQRGWRLLVYTKSSCPLVDASIAYGKDDRPYAGCAGWNADVQRIMARERPDLVLTSSTSYLVNEGGGVLDQAASDAAVEKGFRESWARLVALGASVVPIADTPRPGFDMGECVSANEGSLTTCATERSTALSLAAPTVTAAAKGQQGVHLLDLNDFVCPDTRCAPVIGHVLVFRDESHLTATYARSLAAAALARLQEVVDVP